MRGLRRILVLGSPGAGKSYFANRLAAMLELDVIHLDALFWRPGRIPTPVEEWRATVSSLVRRDAWVMDGTYEQSLDIRVPAADAVFLIDKSKASCLWRIVRRKAVQYGTVRPDAPHGHGGGLDWQLIKYIWKFPTASRPLIVEKVKELGRDPLFLTFNGIRGCSEFTQALAESMQTVAGTQRTEA